MLTSIRSDLVSAQIPQSFRNSILKIENTIPKSKTRSTGTRYYQTMQLAISRLLRAFPEGSS